MQDWVQLNYDGLAQKAGCPQEGLLEVTAGRRRSLSRFQVHGSWYDPSNPVVKARGKLREDLHQAVAQSAETADLCLALGTSLRGTTVDTVATLPAQRSLAGRALGTAIVSLQQTAEDGVATLRIFCSLERFLALLLRALNLELPFPLADLALSQPVVHSVRVPYDHRGWRSTNKTCILNLKPGAQVRLHENHSWRSCGQRRGGQVTTGEGRVVSYSSTQRAWQLEVDGVTMLLGHWWMEAVTRGVVPFLPVLSSNPEVVVVAEG